MPAGFEVFDQFGNKKIDGTDRIPRFLGIFFFPAGAAGTITIDGLLTGAPFFSATPHGSALGFGANNETVPSIIFDGNLMHFSSFLCDQRIIVWVY
ncbi:MULTISPECIES: hypothetical protein [unclassified Bosea (in: a-proteobacteria)]|uniref:hypothetical protein n=1 Tax=unclassified Bosea (in: a-proteobacteria) TaxID=2653178 RepID=UPI000F763F6C|nr:MULTISPECIES: hypothetical protein [unclassified Bosea (in: a-proteobacteria)]AZO77466.1 hypothetical protein BLM15_07470 [Bosea sp. Tri-49]RXT18072.1 hypothetical protein B5U98_22625 [Bosea sp. Tri-39]RXT32670.1 hypothetical protein B5U99_28970 [Bosea sp. Tri-54]